MKRFLCVMVLGLVTVLSTGTAQATVDLSEGFEYADNAAMLNVWSSSCSPATTAGIMDVSTARIHSGAKSLKVSYPSPDQAGGCYMSRYLSALTDIFYMRVWGFFENFSITAGVPAKLWLIADASGPGIYPNFWSSMESGTRNWGIGITTTLAGTTVYSVHGGSIPANQWACLEYEVRMNTPGVSNGVIRAWINDVVVAERTDLLLRGSTDNGQGNGPTSAMNFIQVYRQHGVGTIYYDDYAASRDARIGCGGVPPPADTTPPSPVTGLAVSTSGSATWNATTDTGGSGLAGYHLLQCTGAACTPTTGATTANTSFNATVSPGVVYGFAVNAFDNAGNTSGTSSTVYITATATFRSTLFTDTFNRADNSDLGASYTDSYTSQGAGQILSQRMLPTTVNTLALEQYTGVSTPNDQWCEWTIGTIAGAQNAEQGCHVRLQNTPTWNGYLCRAGINETNKGALRRMDAGSSNTLGVNDTTVVWAAGDKGRCEAQGDTIRYYRTPVGGAEYLLTSATDATYSSGTTGLYNFVATAGTLTNSQMSRFSMGGFSASVSSSAPVVDAVSSSATGNTTNTISWTHTVGSGSNRFLAVCPMARDTVAGNVAVSTVTANGAPMTKLRADVRTNGGNSFATEFWYLANPGVGANTIAITFAGALSAYGVGSAISFTGVDQVAPIDAQGGGGGAGSAIADNITTVADHALIVDCVISQAGSLVVGSGQTQRENRDTTGIVDSTGISTVNDKTPAGVEAMDWTQGDVTNWVQSIASLKPAAVTPVVYPTITAVTLDATGANVTWNLTTPPTQIRVTTFTNSGSFSSSLTLPISSFPGGRYTNTWRDGLDGACFFPIDSLGVENDLATAYVCGSLTGIVNPVDTTPIVMTQTLPAGTLNKDTTTTTIAVLLNKAAATCKWDTSNTTYALMANTMSLAALSASASTGAVLSNGTTTHFYVQCMFVNTLDAQIPTTTALDIPVTVAAGVPADTTAPSTVAGLAGTPIGQSQVSLVWTAATDNVAVQAYQVYADSTGACTTFTPAALPTAATDIIVNLPPASPISFVVRAIDTSQNYSAADSNCVTVTTSPVADVIPPSTMTNLRTVGGPYTNSVDLTWDPGSDNGGSVTATIEMSAAGCTSFAFSISHIALSQLRIGLAPSTTYCFRGLFTDQAGNASVAYSNVLEVTTSASGLAAPRVPLPFGTSRSSAGTTRSAAGARAARP